MYGTPLLYWLYCCTGWGGSPASRQIKVLPGLGKEAIAWRSVHGKLEHLFPQELRDAETCARGVRLAPP